MLELSDAQVAIAHEPVETSPAVHLQPDVAARGMLLRDADGIEHVGTPLKFQAEPGQVSFSVPAHGEHTGEVLSAIGYGNAELAALREAGAIG